ncbi:MAG TPA: hypothetical protein VKU86_13825 [Acidimicrobiales bacterium]|nr:hypothetical protein [Acidimicrobiales bacterium]
MPTVALSSGMARRIDIELTSRRDDGSWTWRAPGARQPRGTVAGALVPEGSGVGDVLRAEAEFDLDGIVVTAVQRSRVDSRAGRTAERIELLANERDAPGGVSVVLAPGTRRRRDDGDDRREGRPPRGPRRPREEARGGQPDGPRREGRPRSERARPAPSERTEGDATRRGDRRPPRPDREGRGRAPGRNDEERGGRSGRPERTDRQRRLQPVATNRNAALAELRPEQLPVAEQLLRGGIPAVRQAIAEQNARARAEGRNEVTAEPLLALAEQLLPKMNLATWKDRAITVRTAGKDAPLRELRSVVTAASTVNLDDDGRELATHLRDALQSRVTALREAWVGRITNALDGGQVEEALRVATRPPEPTARISAELATRLSQSAGAAMSPDAGEAQWLALLDAAIDSPVRRTVKPAGLPRDAGADLVNRARRAAGMIPELARLLGLPIPPPPGPRRPSASAARGA